MRRTMALVVTLPAVLLISALGPVGQAAQATLTLERSTPGSVDTSDGAAPAPPAPSRDPTVTPPDSASDGDAAQADDSSSAPVAPPVDLRSPEGYLIAPGGTVSGTGPRWRYTVEVEVATGLDVDEVARVVARSLHDDRSWASKRTLELVDDPTSARIRLLVATPDTVDRLCAEVGLQTVGIFSCWNGRFAAMNSWRWEVGASGFEDIETYRTYLVNHEFGHGLGYGHVGCPAQGAPAPVMMQQSKGLSGCLANGWPYP